MLFVSFIYFQSILGIDPGSDFFSPRFDDPTLTRLELYMGLVLECSGALVDFCLILRGFTEWMKNAWGELEERKRF